MLNTQRLLRVGLAKAKEQQAWAEGISLEKAARASIDVINKRVAVARYKLAVDLGKQCTYVPTASVSMQRLAISRAYYAMYHAIRASAYMHYRGDDHQGHSDLPQKVPHDFPNAGVWSNQLKSAREYRNQADYDPYPRSLNYWRAAAFAVNNDYKVLMPVARAYLRSKGCNI